MNPRHDLIIFDWDGTLMDSIAKIVRCFTAALDDVGVPRPGEDATRHVIGLGLAEAVATLLPQIDAGTRAQVVERYRQHFLHHDQTDMPLFPGVREEIIWVYGFWALWETLQLVIYFRERNAFRIFVRVCRETVFKRSS